MNVRFAEELDRDDPLELIGHEKNVALESELDGRSHIQMSTKCEKDVYIGVFFDGTNNMNNNLKHNKG